MKKKKPNTLEEFLEILKTQQITPEECYSYIIKIEEKIKMDIDSLFEGLAGGHIHEIQSKIGYVKNLINLVVDSNGAFEYDRALDSAILQLEDILALYQKSGVSIQIEK
ncbi:MAG: hypothetical protein ACFFD2_04475 [Promethearchaeota archaeon]